MGDISKAELKKKIAAILKDANLATTTSKKVRLDLEESMGVKLMSRKKEIDELVMEYVSSNQKVSKAKGPQTPAKKAGRNSKKASESEEDEDEEDEDEEEERTNGATHESEDEDDEEEEEDKVAKTSNKGKAKPASVAKKTTPAKKAPKRSYNSEESEKSDGDGESEEDEEEYSPKKAKVAKGRKPTPKKKNKRKKGGDSESDSDEEWGKKKGGKKAGGKRGTGFTKKINLSPQLAALMGEESMARHEVVKKVWGIIKERGLLDPENKQFAICDPDLTKVMGVKRFRTFGMLKLLKPHFVS